MTKITKKEIRGNVQEAIKQSLSNYETTSSPKKTDKIVKKFAKKMAKVIKGSLVKKKAETKVKKVKVQSAVVLS